MVQEHCVGEAFCLHWRWDSADELMVAREQVCEQAVVTICPRVHAGADRAVELRVVRTHHNRWAGRHDGHVYAWSSGAAGIKGGGGLGSSSPAKSSQGLWAHLARSIAGQR